MITVERANGAEYRVLQRILEIALIKNHAAGIIFEVALDRPEQIQKANSLFLSIHRKISILAK